MSSLSTLCNKTIEDTLITIRHYENARLEFDAYRCDLEELSAGAGAAAQATKVRSLWRSFTNGFVSSVVIIFFPLRDNDDSRMEPQRLDPQRLVHTDEDYFLIRFTVLPC